MAFPPRKCSHSSAGRAILLLFFVVGRPLFPKPGFILFRSKLQDRPPDFSIDQLHNLAGFMMPVGSRASLTARIAPTAAAPCVLAVHHLRRKRLRAQ